MLNLFLLFVAGYVIGRMIGGRIGYLKGKMEVSHIPRGQLPEDECLVKEMRVCNKDHVANGGLIDCGEIREDIEKHFEKISKGQVI